MRISDWSSDVCSSDLAGDVAGVAAVAGAGVDQEAAHRLRRQAPEFGVVQDRAVLVERDDVAVGQLIGILPGGLAVGQGAAELAGTGAEGAIGGAVRSEQTTSEPQSRLRSPYAVPRWHEKSTAHPDACRM